MTTSLDRIKQLDASTPIPKLPRAYRDDDPVRAEYARAIVAHRALWRSLAEDFVVQMQGADGIPQQLLDSSPTSLERIDEHIIATDYRTAYKKDYLASNLVPSLGGYVAHVCDVHLIDAAEDRLSNLSWQWGQRVRQHVLHTQAGLKTFDPFAAADVAIESGFPLATFYATAAWYQAEQYLISITIAPSSPAFVPTERGRLTALAALRSFFPDAHLRPRVFNSATKLRALDRTEHIATCALEVGYLAPREGPRVRPTITSAQHAELAAILGCELVLLDTGYPA